MSAAWAGKARQERAHLVAAPVEGQPELMIGEQARSVLPVAGGLRVVDRVDSIPVTLEPAGGCVVQRGDDRRVEPPQLQPQQIGEQVVVAKRRAPDVDRGHERAGVLELMQDAQRPRAAGERVAERSVDAVEHRGPQEQIADLWGLAVEHLGVQNAATVRSAPQNSAT